MSTAEARVSIALSDHNYITVYNIRFISSRDRSFSFASSWLRFVVSQQVKYTVCSPAIYHYSFLYYNMWNNSKGSQNPTLITVYKTFCSSAYPEWPYRQDGYLACWRLQDRFPAETALIYTMHEAFRGYCPWGLGVRPVIWTSLTPLSVADCPSTATRSSPLGYFSRLLRVAHNWRHILW